jgi:hypothetical protein
MVILGGIAAFYGISTGNKTASLLIRILAGGVAGAGVVDIVRGFMKKAVVAPMTPAAAPAANPHASSIPGDTFEGLGSEWYRNDPTDAYLNRFADALRPKCGCGMNGLSQCYSCIG